MYKGSLWRMNDGWSATLPTNFGYITVLRGGTVFTILEHDAAAPRIRVLVNGHVGWVRSSNMEYATPEIPADD